MGTNQQSCRHSIRCQSGTIDKEEDIRARTSTGVAVPKYYFIAVLSYKNKQYKGIAFYVEHTNNKTNLIKRYSMSIRELEQKTGINFFHNLEDAIENNVEINYNPVIGVGEKVNPQHTRKYK